MDKKLILKRILFYFLSFTWGGILSMIGAIVTLVLLPFGGKVKMYHGRIYTMIGGKNWGGFELGCFFVCSEEDSEQTKAHESGHSIQNCIWGPLMIPVITLPSTIRFWYRELKYCRKGLPCPTEYDDIWFEGQATRWGYKYAATDKF